MFVERETRKKERGGKKNEKKKLAKIGKSSASRRTKISCHVLPWKINRFRTPRGGGGCGFRSYCHLAPRWSQSPPVLEDELIRKFSMNASACMKINGRGVRWRGVISRPSKALQDRPRWWWSLPVRNKQTRDNPRWLVIRHSKSYVCWCPLTRVAYVLRNQPSKIL